MYGRPKLLSTPPTSLRAGSVPSTHYYRYDGTSDSEIIKGGSETAVGASRKSGGMDVGYYGDHTTKVHRHRITVTDVLFLFRTLSPRMS